MQRLPVPTHICWLMFETTGHCSPFHHWSQTEHCPSYGGGSQEGRNQHLQMSPYILGTTLAVLHTWLYYTEIVAILYHALRTWDVETLSNFPKILQLVVNRDLKLSLIPNCTLFPYCAVLVCKPSASMSFHLKIAVNYLTGFLLK